MGGGASTHKKEKKAPAEGQEPTPELQEYLERVFQQSDADNSGELDADEFFTMLTTIDLNLTAEDVEKLRAQADVDGNGTISLAEVLPVAGPLLAAVYEAHESTDRDWCQLPADAEGARQFWYNKRSEDGQWEEPDNLAPPSIDDWMAHVFRAHDEDGSGSLSVDALVGLLQAQLSLADEDVEALRKTADANADGRVDWAEFVPVAHQALQSAYATHDTTDGDVCTLLAENGYAFSFNKRTNECHWLAEDGVPSVQDTLARAFEAADADQSGELSAEEFWTALRGIDASLTDENIQQLKERADVDNDGSVAWHEFLPVAAELLAGLDYERDWHQLISADGTPFWSNMRTGETRWLEPGEEGAQAPTGPSVVDAVTAALVALDPDGSGSVAADAFWPAVQPALGMTDAELEAVRAACPTPDDPFEYAPVVLAVVAALKDAAAEEGSGVTLAYADGTEFGYDKKTGEAWWPAPTEGSASGEAAGAAASEGEAKAEGEAEAKEG